MESWGWGITPRQSLRKRYEIVFSKVAVIIPSDIFGSLKAKCLEKWQLKQTPILQIWTTASTKISLSLTIFLKTRCFSIMFDCP